VAKNLLVISVITILLAHNVLSLYAEAFFCGDSPLACTFKQIDKSEELAFTEDQSDLLFQFIFDSEFKNINANTNVFEEHKNLNFENRSNESSFLSLTLPRFLYELNFNAGWLSSCFPLLNSCNTYLYGYLCCFRI
jgi:hypothetical protein